jgi:hypothetical protein
MEEGVGAEQSVSGGRVMNSDWLRPEWAFGPWPQAAAQAFEALQKAARVATPDGWPVGPAAGIQSVAAAARTGLVGRPVTLRFGSTDVRLVLTDLVVQPDPVGAAFGQFDDVRLSARDVKWDGGQLNQLVVVCKNVHLRLGTTLTLVAAPIHVEITVDQSALDGWLTHRSDRVALRLGDDDTVRVELTGHSGLGVEVHPSVEGDVVRLAPSSLVGFGRRFKLTRRLPVVRLRLPRLPPGLRITGLAVSGCELRAFGAFDEWREPLSATQLVDLARRLRHPGARVEVPRLPPHGPNPE